MRTARLTEVYDVELRHTLFPLHPDTPPEGLTLAALFGPGADVAAMHERMSRLMEEEGLPYGSRTHTFNSRKAQELAKWAESQPGGEGIHAALYESYFVRGENLADPAVLAEVVRRLELDEGPALQALEAGDYVADVDRDWDRARSLGVTGVPTFLAGRYGVVGAQGYDVLERLVLEGGAQAR